MTMPRAPQDSGVYRLSDAFIARAGVGILVTMVVLFCSGLALGLASDQLTSPPEWVGSLAAVLAVGGLVVPLWLSAVLGGYAIHRLGWVPGLLLPPSVVAAGVGFVAGGWWAVAGVLSLAVTVGGFFLAGYRGGVPMWLSAHPGVRSVTLTEGSAGRRSRREGPSTGPSRRERRRSRPPRQT